MPQVICAAFLNASKIPPNPSHLFRSLPKDPGLILIVRAGVGLLRYAVIPILTGLIGHLRRGSEVNAGGCALGWCFVAAHLAANLPGDAV